MGHKPCQLFGSCNAVGSESGSYSDAVGWAMQHIEHFMVLASVCEPMESCMQKGDELLGVMCSAL